METNYEVQSTIKSTLNDKTGKKEEKNKIWSRSWD